MAQQATSQGRIFYPNDDADDQQDSGRDTTHNLFQPPRVPRAIMCLHHCTILGRWGRLVPIGLIDKFEETFTDTLDFINSLWNEVY